MIEGWLDEIEAEVRTGVAGRRSLSVAELAAALRVSERCAENYVTLLASAGRLRIERVALPRESGAIVDVARTAA
jgi:hypothetical protein